MTTTLISYIILSLCIASLLFAEVWAKSKKSQQLSDAIKGTRQMAVLNRKHLSGIFVFAISCWYFSSLPDSNIQLFEPALTNEWSYIFLMLLITAVMAGYKSAANISAKQFAFPINAVSAAMYLLIRTLFLILYECFFRGVLLFILINDSGVLFAIVVNLILYVLVHYQSSRKQIIGCLPFGLLLCIVTLANNSVWPAVLIHLALAMSYDIKLISINQSFFKSQAL